MSWSSELDVCYTATVLRFNGLIEVWDLCQCAVWGGCAGADRQESALCTSDR